MNIFELSVIQSYSIGPAALIGLVRFKKINKSYRPFIILCCVAFLNELLSTFAAYQYGCNAINANIYVGVEAMLFIWLFKNRGVFRGNKWFISSIVFLSVTWIFDNIIWHSLKEFNSLFRIGYSFCLIILAIELLNKLIVQTRINLSREPWFFICAGILIFYSYKATIEVFYLFKLNFSNDFYNNCHFILEIVNLFVNLLYAWAVLWMPQRQKFIWLY